MLILVKVAVPPNFKVTSHDYIFNFQYFAHLLIFLQFRGPCSNDIISARDPGGGGTCISGWISSA